MAFQVSATMPTSTPVFKAAAELTVPTVSAMHCGATDASACLLKTKLLPSLFGWSFFDAYTAFIGILFGLLLIGMFRTNEIT
jgi:hypothetical protein